MGEFEINIAEFVASVQFMKPGHTMVYPHRFSSEQRRRVKDALRKAGLRHVGLDLNPTSNGGGTFVYRPEKKKRRSR